MLYPDFRLLTPEEIKVRDELSRIRKIVFGRKPSSEEECISLLKDIDSFLSSKEIEEHISSMYRMLRTVLAEIDDEILQTLTGGGKEK